MHLFISGDKGIGKSTIIRELLIRSTVPFSGFLTVKSNAVLPSQSSVHFLLIDRNDVPSCDNLLFICGEKDNQASLRFDQMSHFLKGFKHDLLVMDELGPHEESAFLFQAGIFSLLDGSIPIIGVLQKCDSIFIKKIISHPNVRLLMLDETNLEEVKTQIETFLHSLERERNLF